MIEGEMLKLSVEEFSRLQDYRSFLNSSRISSSFDITDPLSRTKHNFRSAEAQIRADYIHHFSTFTR